MAMTDGSQLFDVNDIACRVTHSLAEDQLGPVIDLGLERIRIISADKPDLNTLFREGMGKEIECTPNRVGWWSRCYRRLRQ